MSKLASVVTIAGSDSSGGAGIQADIKTIQAMGLFAQSAITALTAQNTTGVQGVLDVDPAFVRAQIDSIFNDIRPDAVKIGMVSSAEIVHAIAEGLKAHEACNIVVDPVMVATSGARLISDEASNALMNELFPLACVITPNLPEAEALSGVHIRSAAEMESVARALANTTGTAVLMKGGHGLHDADDVLCCGGEVTWLHGNRIDNPNTHGTGCTLSSAIACGLACGQSVAEACKNAKDYISGALAAQLDLGKGSGPLDHMWRYR